MPIFELQKAITTDTPRIDVTGILKPGIYRFQLVVINAKGNASAPMDQDVTIVAKTQSPPILTIPIIDRPPSSDFRPIAFQLTVCRSIESQFNPQFNSLFNPPG